MTNTTAATTAAMAGAIDQAMTCDTNGRLADRELMTIDGSTGSNGIGTVPRSSAAR